MSARSNLKEETGFSLIEVLISLVIILIGVLGFAKTQALALSNTNIASVRSIAALQAASLAAVMHANHAYWATGLAPANMTVNGRVISNVTLNGQTAVCSTVTCTATQLAGFDVKNWGENMQRQFPTGRGIIVCSTLTTAPITCTIAITWQEKTVALNAASATTAPAQTYTLMVEP
ncbi:MAG: type IV pilus modification protein PilV [Pseudomonadota bacterium]